MAKDHLIRMAGRIHRQLTRPPLINAEQAKSMNELVSRLRTIERHWELLQQATQRGWHAAAAIKERHLHSEVYKLQIAASYLRVPMLPTSPGLTAPALGTIVAELQQLSAEFEDVELDLKQGLIGVTTGPIVLEEVHLGPFTIDLQVSRLAERLGVDCFSITALEPNPAACRDDTVHPHVQDGHLCAGDATVPITAALTDGRIADAFVLIRSVLQTYNSNSPYIALENWSGIRCSDCDELADSESLHYCNGCERDICDGCYSSCDLCDEGCCLSCLEKDQVSGNRCCSACRNNCSKCNRTVDDESFDQETELCPACLAQQQAELQQENHHESESPLSNLSDLSVPAVPNRGTTISAAQTPSASPLLPTAA